MLITLLASSCQSEDNLDFLSRAGDVSDANTLINLYSTEIENSSDYRAYYNLAYIYLYEKDYENAEKTLLEAISLYPDTYRFYSALLYLYDETGNEDQELELIRKMLSLNYADEDLRNRLMRILDGREDEEAFEVAIETIEYYPDNQIAINILAKRYPFFISRAVVNSTEEDIKNFDLPLMRFALSPLFNPEGYKENFLSLSGGTIIESTEGN